MASVKTPITELDFDGVKAQLREYLATQTQFKDYNFEGSNMSALLDVLAYNTFQNNFYTNMAINEMFLDSAVMKNSVVSHAKELNYLPRSRKSAIAVVNVRIQDSSLVENGPSTLTIPTYTNFGSTFKGDQFNFVTNETYVAKRTEPGVYVAQDVSLYEGQMLASFTREGFIIDADGVLRVQLTNNEVDTDSIVVFVDAEETEDQNIFTRANTIYGVEPLDKVFYIEPYLDDRYAVYFGKNEFGLQPFEYEDVRVRYRVCSGEEANGANIFTASFVEGASISCTTVTPAAGGQERETLESIRYFAPKALQIQERAVTSRDYEVLLMQKFPDIKSVSAYGGEQLDPPQFGKVAISVYLSSESELISKTLSNAYVTFLRDKSPLGIEPIFVQTKYVYADASIAIRYSLKNTEKSAAQLESMARAALSTYATENLEDFNRTLRSSVLTGIVSDVDAGILSADVEILPIIEYSPVINMVTNPTFRFEAELHRPYPFRSTNGFDNYKSAIRSSPFDVNGTCVYLQDDGLGNMMTVTDDMNNPQVINPSAGTVDYSTGEVKLNRFTTEEYTGNAIKIMARLKDSDYTSPKGRVFILRDTDIKITMELEERGAAPVINTATPVGTVSSSGIGTGSSIY